MPGIMGNTERGTATIELALVFSLLFGLLWGVISYAFPLILLQAMNKATVEAVRVAATVPLTTTDYQGAIRTLAAQEMQAQLSWLPADWTAPIDTASVSNITFSNNTACPASRPSCLVTIRLRYADYQTQPIVPAITLPIIGQIPRLPQHVEAVSQTIL